METVTQIVKGTTAKLTHVCNGKVYFRIDTAEHAYRLEINSMDAEWLDIQIMASYQTITLMRWIRKGIDNDDGTFIQLK